jgi:hypothetical protein
MNEITKNTVMQGEISLLYDEAALQVPEDVVEEKQVKAWISKRVLELSEIQRKQKQTIQVLLVSWITDTNGGEPIWTHHPNNYETLRDFLMDVGTEREGNKLSPSVVSEMISVAEIIVPYCRANGIDIDVFIASKMWTKLREVVSYIRSLVENNEREEILDVLDDVKALPSRLALREKYRKTRNPKYARSDVVTKNGTSIVVTVVSTDQLADIKRALGRHTDWDAIAVGKFGDRTVNITVKP